MIIFRRIRRIDVKDMTCNSLIVDFVRNIKDDINQIETR